MNDFKERNKVKVPLYERVKNDIEQGKTEIRKKQVGLTEEEKKRNEVVSLIMSFYNRTLTKEGEEKLLAIDEKDIPDYMFSILYRMAKEYIETGKMTEQTIKATEKEVYFSQVGDWSKDPKEWEKGEREKGDAR